MCVCVCVQSSGRGRYIEVYEPVVSVSLGPVETLGRLIVDTALTYGHLSRDQHII